MKWQGKHIVLIGPSGCGKSTVGPLLAKALKRPFHDSDMEIETVQRMTIAELFSLYGERRFRAIESAILNRMLASTKPSVISAGGGSVTTGSVRMRIKSTSVSVYLRTNQNALVKRLLGTTNRPLLTRERDTAQVSGATLKQRVWQLLQTRRSFYEAADIHVRTTNRSPQEVCAQILGLVKHGENE